MKKMFLGLILVFLLSGCTAEYNLTIDDIDNMTYDENFEIKSSNYEEVSSIYDSKIPVNAYDDEFFDSESNDKIEGVSYYDVKSLKKNDAYLVDFHFTFPSNRFDHAAGLKTGFYDFTKTYNEDDKTITLDTGYFDASKFPDLEKLTINVKVLNEVVSHNADEVIGNTYQWTITDFENARLVLTYKKEEKSETKNQSVIIITVFVCMVFLVIFIVVIKKIQARKYT